MEQIVLPRLAGTREAVGDLLAAQAVPSPLSGQTVVVLCRELASGSPSFADELVKELVEDRSAAELVLVGAPARFQHHVQAAAVRRDVAGRVRLGNGAELGV